MIPGARVGHWTGDRTGCTVVVFDEPAVASGEVRGGAPATREFALLDPVRTVGAIDAVVLSGGSAFGLATADGVVHALREDRRGFETSAGPVPIVPTMALFDLTTEAFAPPGADEGAAAYRAASTDFEVGSIGVGAGARSGRWRGPDANRPSGLGRAWLEHDGLVVAALAAVNAVGEVDVADPEAVAVEWPAATPPLENTTLVVVVTNAALTKLDCHLVAQSGHDGLSRALFPVHTASDGDAVVAAATGEVEATLARVRSLAVLAVERAIRDAAG